ncbi:uncharacterized protein LOC123322115 [Coccinella septempunctata]|uniref:uncharacterized protein LOC123322115 n=1 Tax=Coccinella septempunctata TaxID=41139 RepID=UPI001D0859BA|nr:uncharacterized protein LOC123322115 [Coccinella septempunctata]
MKDYDLLYNEGMVNRADGVVVFIKSCMRYTYEVVDIGRCKAIEIKIVERGHTLVITAIYRSHELIDVDFVDDFFLYFNRISSFTTSFHVIVGDINIDILNQSVIASRYLDLLYENGFEAMITTITRPESATCLDHIFLKDDTVVFYEDETWDKLKRKVEVDLRCLIDAFSARFLTVNFKTEHM